MQESNSTGFRIQKKLLHLLKKELAANTTPLKASLSLSAGVTMAVSPFHGLQVILVLVLAFIFKLNRPLALIGVQVSSAPVIPFWIAAGLWLGKLIIPVENAIHMANSIESIIPHAILSIIQTKFFYGFLYGFIQWFFGTIVLAPVCGIIVFVISWPLFRFLKKRSCKIAGN